MKRKQLKQGSKLIKNIAPTTSKIMELHSKLGRPPTIKEIQEGLKPRKRVK